MVKKVFIIMIIIMVSTCFINQVYALSIDEIFNLGDSFIDAGNNEIVGDNSKVGNASNLIFNILYAIAMLLAIIIGIVLGIKYMTASVEGKAEVKQSLIAYFVGVTILFGAYGIWKTIIEILN